MNFDPNKTYDDEGRFSPIAIGWHTMQVTKAILGENRKGAPQLIFQYTCLTPHADKGKTMLDFIQLVDAFYGYGKLGRLWKAADPAAKRGGMDPHEQRSVLDTLVGKILNVRVVHNPDTRPGSDEGAVFVNADEYGFCNPKRREAVFSEIGGEPQPEEAWYTDLKGEELLNTRKQQPSESAEDEWSDEGIPF